MMTNTDAETLLVAEALDVAPSTVRAISREPLGRGTVSGFEITAPGGPSAIAYLDTSHTAVAAETGLALEDGTRVWIHPADPHLPAFLPTAFGAAAATLLERLGIHGTERIDLIAYRPGRRAVVRADTGSAAWWIKVVRPRRVSHIVGLHRDLAAAGIPVPAVIGWSGEGLLVLGSASGAPATAASWTPDALLDAVEAVRAQLSAAPLTSPARTSLLARVPWYAERLAAHVDAGVVDELRHGIDGLARGASSGEATIHGDLHLGQLFLGSDGAISGLIDVDTAGRGDPADDTSAFIGHALASAYMATGDDARRRLRELADAASSRWGDPRTRALTAVHLLGHALGAAERGESDAAVALLAEAARRLSDAV